MIPGSTSKIIEMGVNGAQVFPCCLGHGMALAVARQEHVHDVVVFGVRQNVHPSPVCDHVYAGQQASPPLHQGQSVFLVEALRKLISSKRISAKVDICRTASLARPDECLISRNT